MILILTDQYDKHADAVIELISKENAKFFRFNLDVNSLKKTFLSFNGTEWFITVNGKSISPSEISCVWHRRSFVEMTLEEQVDNSADFKIWKNEWNKTLLGLYLSLIEVPWLNPIRKSHKAENKYLQFQIAQKVGFTTPKMIVTNEKQKLLQFYEINNPVVLKMMSQDFYQTSENTFKGIYVNKVSYDDLLQFEEYSENPIVLQQYIPKKYEVRYTVVGDKHFVCKIESQKSKIANIDWRRYDIANTPHFAIEPPTEVKENVRKFMSDMDLEYGALDFIVTEKDEWIFLEVNSMGQWLWIEDLTGLPISELICSWLTSKYRERGC
ncbi:MvdC/MvdD family ATP grasp protein [Neobacillus drentensis]|uniref:MvdC/MvdD family ATP grasp protein n=1 Tax=Neobacillus drentensis TaxID=220684 RepID=UPI0030032E3B